jgi:hypothetical protein
LQGLLHDQRSYQAKGESGEGTPDQRMVALVPPRHAEYAETEEDKGVCDGDDPEQLRGRSAFEQAAHRGSLSP